MMKTIFGSSCIRPAAVFFTFCCLAGCISIQEAGKEIWGSSIAHLEKARKSGVSREFVLPLDECFGKTQKLLEDAGATVTLKDKDKKYLAAMNFKGHVDTTQAGVFFTKVDDRTTKIEVASMSPALVDEVSDMVFSGLEEKTK